MKTISNIIYTTFALACFELSPAAKADTQCQADTWTAKAPPAPPLAELFFRQCGLALK